MNVTFYAAMDKGREMMLANAIARGADLAGDKVNIRPAVSYSADDRPDAACVFGVKENSRLIVEDLSRRGIPWIYIDKGFTRSKGGNGHTEYSRVCVNAVHPLDYMMVPRSGDRWERLGITLKPERQNGRHILVCGASAKMHRFLGLSEPSVWARDVISQLRETTARPIVYRPKPSWRERVAVPGAGLSPSGRPLRDDLVDCHAVVTYATTVAADAIFAGVPAVALGPSIARPVSSQTLEGIDQITMPSQDKVRRWAESMAYCQWTVDEMASGEAWGYVRWALTK